MKDLLDKAIQYRKDRKYTESNQLLHKLVKKFPDDAHLNYQCAWSYDLLGEEAKAVPYYEKAIKLGLPAEDLEGAIIGLGSTYRTLGKYVQSQDTFLKGMELFPNNRAIQTFYALTLYNLNEHNKAMELLLNCLIDTTQDENILKYSKAISFYSDKLNKIWN